MRFFFVCDLYFLVNLDFCDFFVCDLFLGALFFFWMNLGVIDGSRILSMGLNPGSNVGLWINLTGFVDGSN